MNQDQERMKENDDQRSENLRRRYRGRTAALHEQRELLSSAGENDSGRRKLPKLYDAVDKGNLDTAFEAAHALKGSAGNLSLTPIFAPISEITELLRARTQTDYTALITKIREARDELARICEE